VLGRATYLVLLAGCVLVTLPLELVLGARVYARPRRWLTACAPVLVAFTLWDYLAIRRGHWSYDPRHLSGVRLLGVLPLEELLFFVVVPTCVLLTYEAVGRVLRGSGGLESEAGTQAAGGHAQPSGSPPVNRRGRPQR